MSINTLICYHEPGESIPTHLTLERRELSWKVAMAGCECESERGRRGVSLYPGAKGGGVEGALRY